MLNSFANESISFDAMAKQTPYRYSADAKEIIRNVHNFCKQEKEDGLKISLNQAKERTSTMTGVSKSTIERLMKRDKTKEEKPELPRTKRVQLDEFDFGVLRRTVNAMYSERRILLSNSNAEGHWLHRQQEYPEKVHASAGIYLQEKPNQP